MKAQWCPKQQQTYYTSLVLLLPARPCPPARSSRLVGQERQILNKVPAWPLRPLRRRVAGSGAQARHAVAACPRLDAPASKLRQPPCNPKTQPPPGNIKVRTRSCPGPSTSRGAVSKPCGAGSCISDVAVRCRIAAVVQQLSPPTRRTARRSTPLPSDRWRSRRGRRSGDRAWQSAPWPPS